MGTLFLIDSNTPVLLNSEINDTIPLEAGDTQVLNGSFGLTIPFGVPVDGVPENLSDLLTQKFTGLLAYYPGFTDITYDEGIDASGWDPVGSGGVFMGDRGTTSMSDSGSLRSNAAALTSTPSSAIVLWDLFEVLFDDPKDGIKTRIFREVDPSNVSVDVSFNGGGTWITGITEGVQLSIPIGSQGSSFMIQINNDTYGDRLWVGSWAVIY